jgi:hypothetical protein
MASGFTAMFTHNYLIFDEFGIERVLCMKCANPIKTRSEIISKTNPKVIIRELAKHSDYREIPVILEGGKIAFVMVCDECKFFKVNDKIAKDISEQIRNGLRLQLEFEGKLPDLIEEVLKTQNYNVIRKAEVFEITAALRG